jgi:hypothetical protein
MLKDKKVVCRVWSKKLSNLKLFKQYIAEPKANFGQLVILMDILSG